MEGGAILFIFAALALIGFIGWLTWSMAKKRREEFFRVATGLGLTYSANDPFHTVDLPFALFRKGDGRKVENVMDGATNGMRVRLFDYWYYEQTTDSKGGTSRSYYRFSSGLAWFDADVPHLTIAPESLGSRIADKLGFRDIEFESEEFNRAWQVKGDDRRFASAFVDAGMMAWLMDDGGVCAYEVVGPLLLCYRKRLKPVEYPGLVGVLAAFRAKVPEIVRSLYPARSGSASQ